MTMVARNNPLDPYDRALLYGRMNLTSPKCLVTGRIVGEECALCDIHGCSGYKKERKKFLKEFIHWWRETYEHHDYDSQKYKKPICKLIQKTCIHADAQPDEGVYDNCRLCNIYEEWRWRIR